MDLERDVEDGRDWSWKYESNRAGEHSSYRKEKEVLREVGKAGGGAYVEVSIFSGKKDNGFL